MKYLTNILLSLSLTGIIACGGSPEPDPPANVAPNALTSVNFSAEENTEVTLDASGSSDSDGTIASYSWAQSSGTPTVTINNASAAIATFTAPDISSDTPLTFEVTVTDDDGATSSDSVIVTVTPITPTNQPPLASVPTDFNAPENTNVILDGSASSDSDGNIVSYQWSQTGGSPTVNLINSTTATTNFNAPAIDTDMPFTFQLTVTDDQGAINSDSIIVTITNTNVANQPPTADAGIDQMVSAAGSNTPNLGINTDPMVDWTPVHPFVDMVKYSRQWLTGCDIGAQADCTSSNNWDTGESGSLDLDADGWIRSLPSPQDSPIYWFARLFWALDANYIGGRHVVTYDGEGTLDFDLGFNVISNTPGRVVVDIDGTTGALLIKIIDTDPNATGNYIRNIKLVREEHESIDTDANPFNPDYLTALSDFHLIRLQGWLATIDSPQTIWANRPEVDNVTYTGQAGVPIEIQIELANQAAIIPWINISHQVDDNYITQFATLALQNLDPSLDIYVEYTNEGWNGVFSQYNYLISQARAAWPNSSESDFTVSLNWFGERTANICDIWKGVWAQQSSRVHCVMAGQASNSWVVEQAMNCPLSAISPCSAHGIDSIAIAPYFGGELGWSAREAEVEAWDLNTLFAEIDNVSIPTSLTWVDNYIQLANQFNVELIAYEGGQHLVGVNAVVDNTTITNLFIAANRDPRMQQSYQTYFEGWKSRGGGVFANYSHITAPNKWGSWGVLEYLNQVTTPKLQALLDYLLANPMGTARVVLQGSGDDPDGSIANYLWEQTAGQSISLTGEDTNQASFDVPTITSTTELTFRLTVTDNLDATATDEVVITLKP